MSDDNQVNVKVTADTGALAAGMQQSPSLVQQAAERMREQFAQLRDRTTEHMGQAAQAVKASTGSMSAAVQGLTGAFSRVNVVVAAAMAVLAGGAMFGSGIKATQQFTGEANTLAKTLGITTTEASALNVALGDIGSDASTFAGAAAMLGRQLKTNEAELKAMGLETRNADGSFRNLNDLMMDSIKVINGYKEGTDRNMAATAMWGRGAAEAAGLLRLNNDVVEEAKKKQEELGLVVGTENVAASKRYKAAMNDAGDVVMALKKAVGDAAMPVLTRLAEWFAEIAPPAVFAFKVALDAVATAVHVVIGALRQLWIVIGAVADPLATIGRAIRKLLTGDVAGAQQELTSIFTNWGNAFASLGDRMKADAERTWSDISALWGKPTPTPGKGNPTGKNYTGKPDKNGGAGAEAASRVGIWESQLAAAQAAIERQGMLEGQYRQRSLADNLAFYQQLLQRTDLTEKEKQQLVRKTADVEMSMIKESFETQVKALEAEGAVYRNNMDEKLRIEALIQSKYQQGTKEYEAAQGRINALQREAAQQAMQVTQTRAEAETQARLHVIALEEQTLQTTQQLGLASNERVLAAQVQFENRRNEISRQALQDRLSSALMDPDRNPVQVAQINAQLEALEQAHQLKLAQIRGQMAIESSAELNAIWSDLGSRMSSLWDSGVNAMMNGTLTWRNSMRAVGTEMVGWFAGIVKRHVVTWVAGEQGKSAATAVGTAQRWAMESWAAAKSVALWAATAVKNIMASAWEAMAGAWKAMVGIPYVGPFLAVAAAAAAFAGVSALAGRVSSAEGGYDIPSGVNPMTQLHEREMVLPAKHADVIRGLADGDGGGSAVGGSGAPIALHIHALDGASVKRVLMDNPAALAAAVQGAVRSNHLRKTSF